MNFQATAAFDGTRETKWEEPDGGRGKMNLLIRVVGLFFSSEL